MTAYGISFDFWNTLYGNGNEKKRQKCRRDFFYKTVSNYRRIKNSAIDDVFRASYEFFYHEWQNNQRTPTPVKRIVFMAEMLNINLNQSDLEKTVDYFGNLIFSIPPQTLPSVKDIIIKLSENYSLGIISDTGYISGKYIRQFLDREGLFSHFESFVFSDEQPYCKPHPSVFELTRNNLQIEPAKMIHIGDLEKTDIIGAKNSGWISVKFIGASYDSVVDSEADYTIDHFGLFPQLLDSIHRKRGILKEL